MPLSHIDNGKKVRAHGDRYLSLREAECYRAGCRRAVRNQRLRKWNGAVSISPGQDAKHEGRYKVPLFRLRSRWGCDQSCGESLQRQPDRRSQETGGGFRDPGFEPAQAEWQSETGTQKKAERRTESPGDGKQVWPDGKAVLPYPDGLFSSSAKVEGRLFSQKPGGRAGSKIRGGAPEHGSDRVCTGLFHFRRAAGESRDHE